MPDVWWVLVICLAVQWFSNVKVNKGLIKSALHLKDSDSGGVQEPETFSWYLHYFDPGYDIQQGSFQVKEKKKQGEGSTEAYEQVLKMITYLQRVIR